MIRNLKALGLALVAMLAMSAMAAASASAQEGEVYETAGIYPVHIQGADVAQTAGDPTPSLTANGEVVHCTKTLYTGNLTAASKRVTITPTYEDCHSPTPVTVTMNGCAYEFHHATTGANTDTWPITADLECPVGKVAEVHKYSSMANHTAGTSNCTLTMAAQTGLTGATLYEETTAGDPLRIEGTVHSIKTQTHGACSFGFTININAQLHLSATVTGTDGRELGIKH